MELIKNYFKFLFDTILEGLIFFKNNIKTQAIIWLLIIAEVICYLFTVIPIKLNGLTNITIDIMMALSALIFVFCLFLMFKKVFNLASSFLEKDKLSNFQVIKSLVVLGLFNLVPMIVFFFAIPFVKTNTSMMYVQIGLQIFTVLYYLSLFLAISSLVYYQDKNPFYAVYLSIIHTIKNILKTMPLYVLVYVIGQISVILICTLCFYIIAKFIPLTQIFVESFHTIVNSLALYLITPFYIGVQSILIKNSTKGKNNE